MDLKALATVVANKAARPMLHVQKHSPTILFGAGVVGVVATVVLASRATLRLDEVLDEGDELMAKAQVAHDEAWKGYSEDDFRRDLFLIKLKTAGSVAKLYAPAFILGTLSIAALTGAHLTLSRRNVGLTLAYAGLEKAFREYRDRIVGEIGEDRERELRYDLVEYEVTRNTADGPVKEMIKRRGPMGYSIYARLFDQTNKNWTPEHMHNSYFVQCQQRYANDLLNARGHIFLNEVYKMLGMPESREGCIVGWLKGGNGDGFVDFGVFSGDELTGFDFASGDEKSVWLDFNVDGPIWDHF